MQYRFMPGEGAAVVVFVLRRLLEKLRFKSNKLFFIVNSEKAFNSVPKEVIHFSLRQKMFPQYLVKEVMSPGFDIQSSSAPIYLDLQ